VPGDTERRAEGNRGNLDRPHEPGDDPAAVLPAVAAVRVDSHQLSPPEVTVTYQPE